MTTTGTDSDRFDSAAELVSFVPRLTIEWLRSHPERQWLEIDGTLAFVDISGFTAMSEQLSSRGRAGAEEVTDVMNATFSALLDQAYALGGGLLKFGGDALLLLYQGDRHPERAARAAFEMRRTLRAIGRPRTSAGTVQLRMHAGLHTGRFQFFLVGDAHRELLVTGPAATRTVEMEAASEAGEILVSQETAAELDPSTLGDEKGGGRLLQAAPEVAGSLEPLPDLDGVPIEIAVPAPLRAQLLEVGPFEGEHRHAAIAFVRYSGTDEIIATEGPDAAAEAIEVLTRAIEQAASDHDVTFLESDVDRDGGRIILVAGAPQTFGDDEERLLRAVRAIVDAGLPFPLHIGVSEGRVFTGQVGAPFRRTYTILGDTAALAARLMAKAPEDEVWVAASAFERGGAGFASTELEPLQLKGKSEPQRAVVLRELLPEAEEEAGGGEKLPFVDRERERAVLGAAVQPVRMGFGTMVELIGEPGIGKSRLAEELRENCGDMEQITLRCQQYESATAYHPFRPFLRSLLDVELNGGGGHNRAVLSERLTAIDSELVPWAPLLGAPLDVQVESTPEVDDLDPSFRRARLHGVIGSLLGKVLDSPTLLVFEDVHWMDDASSDLLRHIGTQLPTKPWLTCTTRRAEGDGFLAAEGTPPLPALTLRLEPLPPEDAKTLIRAAAGERSLSDEELGAIFDRGAGNPLFLQELASPEGEGDEQMPDTVESLVATRIDRLAPGDRALLRWASVLGVSFSGSLIAAVLEVDSTSDSDAEAWDRLAEFVERDPDVPGAFRFRHALIRDGAYEGLSFKRRRELHARVAEVLEQSDPEGVELLSLHSHRGERWPETWRHSVAAGRRAQAKWANLEAAEFYQRGLDAAEQVPDIGPGEIAQVWEALGDCLQLAGRFDEAERAFGGARRLMPEDSVAVIELMEKEGVLQKDMGNYDEAIRRYNLGLEATDRVPDERERTGLRAKLNFGLAEARFRQGHFEECIEQCNIVVEQALEVGDDERLGWAYMFLHMVHMFHGADERAFRGLALPLFEELGDLKGQAAALNNLGIEAYYEGDWEKAVDVYEQGRRLFERIGDVTNVAMTTNNIAEILSDQGRFDEAHELLEEAREAVDSAGHRALSLMARMNLGRLAARRGRFDEAQTMLGEAVEGFHEIEAASLEEEARARIAEAAVLAGDTELAVREADIAERTGEANPPPPLQAVLHRVRGYAHLQQSREPDAIEEFQRSLSAARAGDALYEIALTLHALGRLGDSSAAAEAATLLARLHVGHVAEVPF